MIDRTLLAHLSGYGYREESISFLEKVRKQGLAAIAFCPVELRKNSLARFRLIPIDSAQQTSLYHFSLRSEIPAGRKDFLPVEPQKRISTSSFS
jgi:hypothetical protein